ncbi:MAG: tetratricopeptide repeat protein [Bryobacteraceae bacterium]|nr:tetratricopeptide repeat protein [Bryobacteraceae bacterium]MDW8379315.1 tetratricopeptide repeat protein [Bryobacterales bacterium]
MTSKVFIIALLALELVFLAGCSRDPNVVKVKYLERGNEYFKNGKYKEASIMYKSALKKDMRYGEAYYRLGLSELRLGRYVDAVRSLRRAVELQPDNLDATTQLADIYLAVFVRDPKKNTEFGKDLEQMAERLLKNDPKSFLGLRIKGFLAVAAGDTKTALEHFEAANRVKPLAKEIIVPLVQSLAVNGRFEEGEKLAYQMIEKDKTLAAIYDWLYLQYINRKQLDKAERVYRLKTDNNPEQAFYLLQLAGHYFLTRNNAEMEKTLARIIANPKAFPLGDVQVGDFYIRIRDVDSAVRHYEEGLKKNPNNKALYQKRIAETLVLRGRSAEALDLVSQVIKENPNDYEATAMRASLWLQDGSRDKVQTAISELNSVIVRQPENVVLRYNLGRAYVAKGDLEQARIQFQEAIKYRPDYTPARIAIAQLHLAKNEFTKALQAAEEILQYDSSNITAQMIRTGARMGLGDRPTARQELTQLLALSPDYPDALFQMGVLNYQEKRYDEAIANFERLQKVAPNDPRGLLGKVQTLQGLKKFDEAIRLLQEDLKVNPQRSFYRLALANTAVEAQQYDLAIGEYRKLLEKNPKNFDVQIRLAETYRRKGDLKTSIAEYEKAKELNPNDAAAYVPLALLYEGEGRPQDAKPLYEQILKLEPDNAVALNNLAYYIAEYGGDLDQALTLAQRAKAKFPHHPDIADTLAYIFVKKNLSDNAIQILREIVNKDQKNPIYRYHLAVALAQKGDKPAARKEAEEALRNKPSKRDEERIRELLSRI